MGDETNTHAPAQDPVVVVFYTTGDSNILKNVNAKNPDGSFANPAPNLLKVDGITAVQASEWFRIRAKTLATPTSNDSYVIPGQSLADATAAVQNMPATLKFKKVYFYGHGNGTGFMLGCFLNPDITANAAQYLTDPNSTDPTVPTSSCRDSGTFFTALLPHLAPDFQIGFLGCHMGLAFVGAIATLFSHQGLTGIVQGYKNETMGRLQFPDLAIDDPGQKFADWLMDDTDKTGQRAKFKAVNNQLPKFDASAKVVP
jgi:hypothetical protein